MHVFLDFPNIFYATANSTKGSKRSITNFCDNIYDIVLPVPGGPHNGKGKIPFLLFS